jgi:hypothetical protein
LADLIAERINTDIAALFVHVWAMFLDGSVCDILFLFGTFQSYTING